MDYKKYSLENLEKWIEDAINSSEASPQEIYDVIKNVVSEEYCIYKNHTSRCYELLALLNGNGNSFNIDPKGNNLDGLIENPIFNIGNPWDNMSLSSAYGNLQTSSLICDKDDKSPECQKSWNDFWEENYYPEETSQYDEEELNAMCDKASSDEEKNKCREYNLREAEYYDKRAEFDFKNFSPYVSEDGDILTEEPKGDKVVKWHLPVELDGLTGECYVQLPDDLLEVANLKEGDTIEWIDRKDGSFEMRKVTK